MSDRDYCYPPDYIVLRNRLNIRDALALEAAERELVAQRLLEPVPAGDFDLDHLKAIHRHLFQDLYAWAGEFAPSRSPRAKAASCQGGSSRLAWRTFTTASSRQGIFRARGRQRTRPPNAYPARSGRVPPSEAVR